MATTTLVTVQEFLQLPEPDGQRIELIGGELVTMSSGKLPHEIVKSNIIHLVAGWLSQNRIARLFAETMYQLNEHTALIPDLSIVSPNRLTLKSGWIEGAPEIAIEVVSSETAAHLDKKISLYLAHGGKSVWVVFPEPRHVRIFDTAGQSKTFEQHQTLEDPNVLPGFSAPVSSFFEGI